MYNSFHCSTYLLFVKVTEALQDLVLMLLDMHKSSVFISYKIVGLGFY